MNVFSMERKVSLLQAAARTGKFCRSITSAKKLYLAFYGMCISFCLTYLFCVRVYNPLLLPTVLTSRDFLLHNEHLCSGSEHVTVMYIYSSTAAFKTREIIRRTFGNVTIHRKYNLRIFFVLGRDHLCTTGATEDSIYKEFTKHKDLLVGDFFDTYRNLSLKGIVALEFINRHCKNARFVIKTDDDVIVDTPELLNNLHQNCNTADHTVWGSLVTKAPALYCVTQAFNKWCILYSHYNKTYYPPYMFGGGFILTADLVIPMLNASYKVAPFPIDDVYITGLLLEAIKDKAVRMIDWTRYIAGTPSETSQRLSDSGGEPLYFAHPLKPDQVEKWWTELRRRRPITQI